MMQLVELALYGVRHCQSMTRIPFGPGLNIVSGGTGTGKSTVWEVLIALLFPDDRQQPRPFVHPHHTDRAQAALVFQTDDQTRYRLVRDFIANRCSLAKLDQGGQASPIVAEETSAVAGRLRQLLPGITAAQLRTHWLLSQRQLPSLSSAAGTNGNAPQPAVTSVPKPVRKVSAGAQSRLEELKRTLAKAEEASAIEEKMMTVQDRAAALQQKITTAGRISEDLTAAKAEEDKFQGFAALPDGFSVLIEGLVERERSLQAQLNGLQEQQETLQAERDLQTGGPIFQQRLFQVGVGMTGLAMIALTVPNRFVTLPDWYGYAVFAALLIPGLGLMGWSLLTDMRTSKQHTALDLKLRAIKLEQEGAEKRFMREQKPALDILVRTDCDDVTAFEQKLRDYRRFREDLDHLVAEQERTLGGQTVDQLKNLHQEADNEYKAMEQKLRDIGAAVGNTMAGDIPSLQSEIARLEGEAGTGSAAVNELSGSAGGGPTDDSPLPGPETVPPSSSWIEHLRTLWPQDNPTLQATISTLFGKLNGGHYTKIEWTNGTMQLQTSEQQPVGPDLLSSGQRDLLLLACFLAPWLHSRRDPVPPVTAGLFPLLLDDPFVTLDATGQVACVQLLRSIGHVQQIVLATRLPVAEQPSDHRITLPLAPSGKEQTGR